jgi:hypothetical protein
MWKLKLLLLLLLWIRKKINYWNSTYLIGRQGVLRKAKNSGSQNFHATNEKSRHAMKPSSDHYVYRFFPVLWVGVYGWRAIQGRVLKAAVSNPSPTQPHDS